MDLTAIDFVWWMLLMNSSCVMWLACLALLVTQSAGADEADLFRRVLFDGKTLNGWTIENDCDVDVVEGCLRLKAGHGWLRHDSRLRDFDLHVEWKALQAKNHDAGIFIRASRAGSPFPRTGHQINLLDGKEGNVPTLAGAESHGLVNPAGEWNSFDAHVIGDTISLMINGQPAWRASGMKERDGWLGFQVEVPNGGQFLLRNIEVVEWGYSSLFNGRDLSGWNKVGEGDGDCWRVSDGVLSCSGAKGPWLRSAAEYGDFNLRLDYRAGFHCNSGVFIRVPEDGNHHRENDTQPAAGIEIQILDDTAGMHRNLKDFQYSASIYDFAGARPHVSRPLGDWNSLEMNCRGQQVSIWHNGVFVATVTAEENPLLGLRSTKGFLGLQNHRTAVQFRHIRIGPAVEELPRDEYRRR